MATPALAGRPLTVDDASVNDTGDGHVEAWYARQPGRLHTWTVAPAYAPIDGLELSASFTRDRTTPQSSEAVQVKWRITPVQESGCNAGAVLGVAHASDGAREPAWDRLFTRIVLRAPAPIGVG